LRSPSQGLFDATFPDQDQHEARQPMSSIVVHSRIFGDMFGTRAMRQVFSDEALIERYLEVEVALARVQAGLGIIPGEAARAIADAARVERVDWDVLAARTAIVGYPILPLVEQLVAWTPDGLGEYCHWGATTQDIMDTADVLQIRSALALVEEDLSAIAMALATLAVDHADTVMPGRTHLQHALPVTFGFKCAGWLASIDRHRRRLDELRERVLVGQFAGAAGTLASLGEQGLAVQEALMRELGLRVPAMTWHTARDGLAEVTGLLALVTGTLGKMGYDIMLMMQTEVGEVFEPFVAGRGASSTMPQKRNPIASEMMLAAAKIVRDHHGSMLDAMVTDHERATGQWHVEWHAMPSAFIVTSGALAAARDCMQGLDVRSDAMLANLDATGGLIVAEAVMMGIAPSLGRQKAHDLVYDCCRESLDSQRPFLDLLCEQPEIAAVATRETLAALTDPANYTGAAPAMVRRYLQQRR
jgi:3-carboxy-cis,cis-muconate cycloisomerase